MRIALMGAALLWAACSVESIGGSGPRGADAGPNLTPDDFSAGGCVLPGLGSVALHSEPNLSSEVVAEVESGTSFTIFEWTTVSGETWLQVQGATAAGWILADVLGLCDQEAPEDPPDPDPPQDQLLGGLQFLLPWTAGDAYRMSVGHNAGAHTGNGAWAWDFGLPNRTPVLAAHDGVVRLAKYSSTSAACNWNNWPNANWVVIVRDDGLESLYLHLAPSDPIVSVGQSVKRGELIGYSGNTGYTCGSGGGYHLHFQVQHALPQGTESAFNTTVHEYFYDTGSPVDPTPGSAPMSANGAGGPSVESLSGRVEPPSVDGHCGGGIVDIAALEAASLQSP